MNNCDNERSFQDQCKEFFDTQGFASIMAIVNTLEGEAKLKWLKELLPYGASKFNSSEYNGKQSRDISIVLELDTNERVERQEVTHHGKTLTGGNTKT